MRFTPIMCLLAAMLLVGSCAQSVNENINRGSDYNFRVGYPEVRMSAIGLFDEEGDPGINISADIVYGSLIYREVEGQQEATITVETRIVRDLDENNDVVVNENYDLTVTGESSSVTSSQELYSFERRYPVSPGTYTVYVTVIDQASNRSTQRETRTLIPVIDVQNPVLTNVQLLGKQNNSEITDYNPISTYDVPGKIDSLKFRFQVTNGDPDNPVTITSELVRYESDTSHARPMSAPEPSPSTIAYKGIDYDEEQVIQTNRRVLNQTGSVLVEFIFPMQIRGNYRFLAQIENQNSDENNVIKARDFSIKSANYPTIQNSRELAGPLAYLMNEREYENLIAIDNADSLKSAVDRFWLRNIGNRSRARQVISLYYQRVEEANKQFSNFKEGWKTDLGMMYILFGPPQDYEESIDGMAWYYSYNRSSFRETFFYYKPQLRTSTYPFDHFILNRNFYYNSLENQRQQLWLSGLILSRPNQ